MDVLLSGSGQAIMAISPFDIATVITGSKSHSDANNERQRRRQNSGDERGRG